MPAVQPLLKPIHPIVNSNHPLARGLVFDVPFFEGAGLFAEEDIISGIELLGTLTNGPTWKRGAYGNMLNFDGSNDIVTFANSAAAQNSLVTISIEALVMATGAGAGGSDARIIHKGNGSDSNKRFVFGFDNAATLLEFQPGFGSGASDGDFGTAAATITQNAWYHVVGTYSFSSTANVPSLYINGVSMAVTTFTAPSGSATADGTEIDIGNRIIGTNRQFNGNMAYVRYWNRILTPGEVWALYTNPWQIYGYKNFMPFFNSNPVAGTSFTVTRMMMGMGM